MNQPSCCIAAVVLALAGILSPSTVKAQASGCLSIDHWARATLHHATHLATASDVETQKDRDAYGILPADSSDVVLITDDLVCARFAEAYVERLSEDEVASDIPPSVHVIRIGSRYLVWDPETATPESEFILFVVFDEKRNEVGGFVG